jgi:DNA-binding transcriptional LysR family regulator
MGHIESGPLVRLLQDWTDPFAGFFLYYPSRRQMQPTLAALISILKAELHDQGNQQR